MALDILYQHSGRYHFGDSDDASGTRPSLSETAQLERDENRLHWPWIACAGLAALQILLDQGQEEDWFGSPFIVVCFCFAAIGIVGGAIWEWFVREPIVNLRLLCDRSLFLGTVLIFLYGMLLYGSTYLLPLFLQSMMGYTAFLAGLALAPGGFLAATIAMPLAGRLTPVIGTRMLLIAAFGLAAIGLHGLGHLTLSVSFGIVALSWFVSRFGLGLVFVPLNIAAFSTITKERMNQASSLINLARNIGAAVGISTMTTVLARRSQFHQATLAAHVTVGLPPLLSRSVSIRHQLLQAYAPADASRRIIGLLYSQLQEQAYLLSFMDAFWILSIIAFALLPIALLLHSVRQKTKQSGEH
jgi:MFS transporter, DHA2 family, multidrug resistance protein